MHAKNAPGDSEKSARFEALRTALNYHERTKHHYHRYAASPGFMDWDTQPDPFRRYHDALLVRLRLPSMDGTPPYRDVFAPGAVDAKPLSFETLSDFFFYSLSLSAWKEYGQNRWSLRVNPSSGNLHPTEGYVVAPAMPGIHTLSAVYHYAPKEHGLERRTEMSEETWKSLMRSFPPDAFLIGLASIHWRESWKYGERAYRYCQHDAGHALAALRISAAVQGWGLHVLDEVSDERAEQLLGLDRPDGFLPEERETPDMLAVVLPRGALSDPLRRVRDIPEDAARTIARGAWTGAANKLSAGHVAWDSIEAVSQACRKNIPVAVPRPDTAALPLSTTRPGRRALAGKIIRQRRSALAMDGAVSLTRDGFYSMLAKVVPTSSSVPWDAIEWAGLVHLGLFVHRVDGLKAGLYVLVRDPSKLNFVKRQMKPEFLWDPAPGAPDGLRLYLLKDGDFRTTAAGVSCGQAIAGDGVFSLGMLAEFEPALLKYGAQLYRNLFWETGMIGQVLYLEAEAWGVRATGIGCFFDDPVHEIFGLRDRSLQSLYHFTVGGAIEDTRLASMSPYPDFGLDGR
ncbi:MAG: SagB/ThcOx family dehydrogenase [Elusimicrobiota bacterium]